ncbi:hypothetical protein C8R44DRAFT_568 [Mycena epipterygia]|nr:hypothetical protein C8R44DRAFT_568 [Mycena epipterygia]
MPGFAVRMELWSMFASFVVSFVSVGWWSSFGDQRGRKPVLFVSLMGAMLLDFIYLAVANTGFQEDGISLGLILDGLLGGFATFNGVLHAYASDVSPNSLSRTVIFGGLQAVSFIFFRFGAFLGLLADGAVPHGILGYAISGFLGCANLVYIYRLLPESLAPQPTEQQPLSQKAALKYIVLPFSLFLSKGPWRKQLVLLACSIYIYCWTLAFGGKMAAFTSDAGYFPALPRWLLLLIPSILNLLTWLCLLPGMSFSFHFPSLVSNADLTQPSHPYSNAHTALRPSLGAPSPNPSPKTPSSSVQ